MLSSDKENHEEKAARSSLSENIIDSDPEDSGPLSFTSNNVLSTRSVLWNILKQLSVDIDLTKIRLPTVVLEPRSTLERLSDFLTHGHLLVSAVNKATQIERFLGVVKFYCSMFHLRPKGVLKPYNALLGERFHCSFNLKDNIYGDSSTEYLAEQVSHHPPISAGFVRNRKHNFYINSYAHTVAKFFKNSAASQPIGDADLTILKYNEVYKWKYPTLYVNGIFVGTLRFEYGDTGSITCPQSGLSCDINFLKKPFFGGTLHQISGQIYSNESGNIKNDKNIKPKVLYTLSGSWDEEVKITDAKTGECTLLWKKSECPIDRKTVIPIANQGKWESRRLWNDLTLTLRKNDHNKAQQHKTLLEDKQRARAIHRETHNGIYRQTFFKKDSKTNGWIFKYIDDTLYSEGENKPKLKEMEEYNETIVDPLSSVSYVPSISNHTEQKE